LVHYVAPRGGKLLDYFLNPEFTRVVSNKIYIVLVGSINFTRQRFLSIDSPEVLAEMLTERGEHERRRYQVAYIEYAHMDDVEFPSSFVDYASIAVRHTKQWAKALVAAFAG